MRQSVVANSTGDGVEMGLAPSRPHPPQGTTDKEHRNTGGPAREDSDLQGSRTYPEGARPVTRNSRVVHPDWSNGILDPDPSRRDSRPPYPQSSFDAVTYALSQCEVDAPSGQGQGTRANRARLPDNVERNQAPPGGATRTKASKTRRPSRTDKKPNTTTIPADPRYEDDFLDKRKASALHEKSGADLITGYRQRCGREMESFFQVGRVRYCTSIR